jgi:hypothetical protein
VSVNEPVSPRRKVKLGSNRAFGITFALVFGVIALWPLWSGGNVRMWAAVAALAFAAVAFAVPHWFAPLNRAWFLLGQALHHVVNPLVMGLIYFGTVVPTGLVLRLLGKDLLHLRRDPQAATYWTAREPPGPPPGSMAKQF